MAQKWDFFRIFAGFYGILMGFVWNVILDGPKVGFLWDFCRILWDFNGICMECDPG